MKTTNADLARSAAINGSDTKIDHLTTRGPATMPDIQTQPVPDVETAPAVAPAEPAPEPAAPDQGEGASASSVQVSEDDRAYLLERGIDVDALAEDMIANDLSAKDVAAMIQRKRGELDPTRPYKIDRLKNGTVVEHYRQPRQKGHMHAAIITIRRLPNGRVEQLHATKGWRRSRGTPEAA